MKPNPSPEIFPELIRLWNESPQLFYRKLAKWGIPNDEADTYLAIIQKWIEETGHPVWLNG